MQIQFPEVVQKFDSFVYEQPEKVELQNGIVFEGENFKITEPIVCDKNLTISGKNVVLESSISAKSILIDVENIFIKNTTERFIEGESSDFSVPIPVSVSEETIDWESLEAPLVKNLLLSTIQNQGTFYAKNNFSISAKKDVLLYGAALLDKKITFKSEGNIFLESPMDENNKKLPPYNFLSAYGEGINIKGKTVSAYGSFIFA